MAANPAFDMLKNIATELVVNNFLSSQFQALVTLIVDSLNSTSEIVNHLNKTIKRETI